MPTKHCSRIRMVSVALNTADVRDMMVFSVVSLPNGMTAYSYTNSPPTARVLNATSRRIGDFAMYRSFNQYRRERRAGRREQDYVEARPQAFARSVYLVSPLTELMPHSLCIRELPRNSSGSHHKLHALCIFQVGTCVPTKGSMNAPVFYESSI